jgi:hypothetical protein
MILTKAPHRTATGIGTLVALILVAVFGSPTYQHWSHAGSPPQDGGELFLKTLAWPAWTFDQNLPVRDLLAADLKSILLVVFTAVFLTLMAGAELAAARGSIAALLSGWGAYVFAAAAAGLLAAFISAHASILTALTWAGGGAVYGLLVGWIVGLGQLGARRS